MRVTADLARGGRVVAIAGAAAQVIGLAWDAVLHRLDPELAAREGVFALSNPGHVLFGGGLALVVLGLGLMLITTGGQRGRLLRWGTAGALAALSLGTVALAATSDGGLTGHSHATETVHVHEDGTEHTHEQHEAFVQGQTSTSEAAHSHGATSTAPSADGSGSAEQSRHQHAPDIPIQATDLVTLQGQLAAAREGTEKYQDVRAALNDGYIQVTQDLPGIAAHFAHPAYALDGVFDPAKPEILLYAKLDGQWKLVGLSYTMAFAGTEVAPEGFAGPLDVWHYHTNLCFRGQRVVSSGGGADACKSAGGRFSQNTGWMMHLWMYSDSPEGLFAHENSMLKGSGAVLTRAEIAGMQ